MTIGLITKLAKYADTLVTLQEDGSSPGFSAPTSDIELIE